jgi:putative FmdB family regulatory protein
MPIYAFRCRACGHDFEEISPLGATQPRTCEKCGGEAKQRFTRVAVKYGSWGFSSTDSLVSDTRGKDFKELRAKAEQISDE